MRRRLRVLGVILLVAFLAGGVMPARATAPVSVTWERNWGTYDGSAPYDPGEFNEPADVATDKWGNVYVAGGASGDDRIQMFDADGNYIQAYDNPGTAAEQLDGPYAVATDRWGSIFVGQWYNQRLEVFNPQLYNHLRTIDVPFPVGAGIIGLSVGLDGTIYDVRYMIDVQVRDWNGAEIAPALTPPNVIGVGVTQDGEVYATCDAPSNMVGVYNPDLSPKWVWGTTGTDPGYYDRPWEAGIDGGGNIFVSEYTNHRVQVQSPNSNVLAVFGNLGAADEMLGGPTGVAVGFDRRVYVCDWLLSRISKWVVSTPTTVAEVEGDDRYATAVAASEKAFPDGADIVVLATGENWPDALGGSALAGAVNGPLLLTRGASLPGVVADEITRLAPKRVYVLGGEAAVSEDVYEEARLLTELEIATRLDGLTRYETAIEVADETRAMLGADYDGTAFVCTGENFPDALAASPMAAANGWPIYLTPQDELRADVIASLQRMYGGNPSNHGYIIGGEAVVSAAVEDELDVIDGLPVAGFGRIAGDTRYETAAILAETAWDGMGMLWSRPAIATGEDFPDALAGGVLQGSDYCVMLLTPGDALSADAHDMLDTYRDHIYEIRFLGGDAAVSPGVRSEVQALLW